jgi:hypothetical protein
MMYSVPPWLAGAIWEGVVLLEYDPPEAALLATGVEGGGGMAWASAKALLKAKVTIAVFHLHFISSPLSLSIFHKWRAPQNG